MHFRLNTFNLNAKLTSEGSCILAVVYLLMLSTHKSISEEVAESPAKCKIF